MDAVRRYALSRVGARLVLAWMSCLPAACAPLRWDKEGLDAVTFEADFQDCRHSAYSAAARHAWLYPPLLLGRDYRGSGAVSPPFRDQADLFFVEQGHLESCMRERGYRPVPAGPGR